MRYYRRRWNEARGDWGRSVWWFEVDDDGWPIRQIEVYDTGPTLRYGPGVEEDAYGGLGPSSVDDFDDDMTPHRVTREDFEQAWRA